MLDIHSVRPSWSDLMIIKTLIIWFDVRITAVHCDHICLLTLILCMKTLIKNWIKNSFHDKDWPQPQPCFRVVMCGQYVAKGSHAKTDWLWVSKCRLFAGSWCSPHVLRVTDRTDWLWVSKCRLFAGSWCSPHVLRVTDGEIDKISSVG